MNGANFLAGEVLDVPRGRLGHGQDTVGRPPSHPLFMLGPVDDECDHARGTARAVVFGACFRCLRKAHGGVDFVAEHPLSVDFFRKQQAAAVKIMSRRPANHSFDVLYRWDDAKMWRGKVPTDRHLYVSLMGRIKPSFGSPHFPCVLDDDDPGTAASTDSAPRHRVHLPGVQAMLMARLVAVAAWGPIGVNEEVDHGPAGAGVDAMWNLTVRSGVANKRRSSTIKRPSMAFAVVRTQLSADGPDEVGTVRMYPSPVSAAYALGRGRVTRMALSAACEGTDPVFLGYSWRYSEKGDLPGETWNQLQLPDATGQLVSVLLWVSSFGRFRLSAEEEPWAAELKGGSVYVPGHGIVMAKHAVLAAYVGLPPGASQLPLPRGHGWCANLTGGVQLIPANLKWMRLVDAVKVSILGRRVRPSPGTRTVTRMPGQIVWRRHVRTALALKTLRNEASQDKAMHVQE